MRRLDDTYRVFGLVGIVVASGLTIAGLVESSGDAQADASPRSAVSLPTEAAQAAPDLLQTRQPPQAARQVRVVYAGPLVSSGSDGDAVPVLRPEARPARPASEPAVVDVTGSIAPAPLPPTRVAYSEAAGERSAPPVPAGSPKLDLNTASIEALNSIPGAGRIGKAVARGRPYNSPEDLLEKRIVTRATFARIRGEVTVE